jgi:uncharacterized protein
MNAKQESGAAQGFDLRAVLSNGLLEKSLSAGRLPAQGELVAADLPRLLGSVVSLDSSIAWSFTAEPMPIGARRRRWWLEARATVSCTCERCLMPVSVGLFARRGFEFFPTAEQADAMTEESLVEGAHGAEALAEIDYLSPEDEMSLIALIEDELLLNLPMAPKHADCQPPEHSPREDGAGAGRESDEPDRVRPLAGLKDLLKKS